MLGYAKIFFNLLILADLVFVEGISEKDRTLNLPDGLFRGTILRSSQTTSVTKFADIPCDTSGVARTDIFISHDMGKRDIPIAVIVDVEDSRDLETSISKTIQKISIIVVHVKLRSVAVVKELNEHEMKSQNVESLQNVLLWLSKNANLLNGDKSSVTAIGIGPDGSRLVSALSIKSENQQFLRRGIVEFGEHTIFSIDGWLGNFIFTDTSFKSKFSNPRTSLRQYLSNDLNFVGWGSAISYENCLAAQYVSPWPRKKPTRGIFGTIPIVRTQIIVGNFKIFPGYICL